MFSSRLRLNHVLGHMENRELTRVDHIEPLVVDVMVAIDAVKDLIDPKGTQCMYFLLAGIANSLLIAFALSGATRCFQVPEVLSSRVHNPLLCLPLIKIPQEYLKLPETVTFDSRRSHVSYHKCESQFLPGSIAVRMKGNEVCQVPSWHLHTWVL